MTSYKQVLIVREDLEMTQGKMISQACHACLGSYRKSDPEVREDWLGQGGKKVVVSAKGQEFPSIMDDARALELPAYLVTDAGRTELEPGTDTAIGVGPGTEEKIDKVTGEFQLVR